MWEAGCVHLVQVEKKLYNEHMLWGCGSNKMQQHPNTVDLWMPNIVWGQILNTFQVWHFINGLHVKLFRELYKWSSHPMIIRRKPTMVSKPCLWTTSPSWGNLPGRWFSNDMFDWGTVRTSDNVGHYLTLSGGYNVQPFQERSHDWKKIFCFRDLDAFWGGGVRVG